MSITVTIGNSDTAGHNWGDCGSWGIGPYDISVGVCCGDLNGGVGRVFDAAVRVPLPIPAGTNISAAHLRLYSPSNQGCVSANLLAKISGEKVLNAAEFSTEADYTGRVKTTAQVDWDRSTWPAFTEWIDTVDISAIVQEIIDQPGWEPGNNIVLFIDDDGCADGNAFYFHNELGMGWEPQLCIDAVYMPDMPAFESESELSYTGTTGQHTIMLMPPFQSESIMVPGLRVYGCPSADFTAQSVLECVDYAKYRLVDPEILYYCILTGLADGVADVALPMSSFQCRYRSGEPTYLSAVVPNIDAWSAAVNARPNGDLVIRMALRKDGVVYQTDEIVRVDLEGVREDKGTVNQSITLDGHRTETFENKTITLDKGTYKRTDNGEYAVRCPAPHIYLRPGDTVAFEDTSFTANLITYSVAVYTGGRIQQSMEVAQ